MEIVRIIDFGPRYYWYYLQTYPSITVIASLTLVLFFLILAVTHKKLSRHHASQTSGTSSKKQVIVKRIASFIILLIIVTVIILILRNGLGDVQFEEPTTEFILVCAMAIGARFILNYFERSRSINNGLYQVFTYLENRFGNERYIFAIVLVSALYYGAKWLVNTMM